MPFPHRHNFYQILLVKQGSGWHEIDFEHLPIEKQRLFLMAPRQVHRWMISARSRGYIVEFEAKTFRSKDVRWNQLGSILHNPHSSLLLNRENYAKVLALIETTYEEYEEKAFGHELILNTTLTQLLVCLSRLIQGSGPRIAANELHEEFMHLVENHFTRQHRVEFYAQTLGLSAKALTMRFYREQLPPLRDLIQERCLLEAKRLLAYSDKSVADIAEILGFYDPN